MQDGSYSVFVDDSYDVIDTDDCSRGKKKARWYTQRAQKEHAAETPAHVGEYQMRSAS